MDSEERGSVFPHLVRLSESFVSFYLYLTAAAAANLFFSLPSRAVEIYRRLIGRCHILKQKGWKCEMCQ